MRQRLAVLVAAAMSLVLAAFLLPLALLVRTVAADRAVSQATAEAQGLVSVIATGDGQALALAVEEMSADRDVAVFLPGGTVVGDQVTATPGVELARRGNSLSVDTAAGREILIAVGLPQGTAVVRTVVPREELTRGVRRAWLILAALGLLMLMAGIAVADRLARRLVRPIGALAGVSHRLAGGDLQARAEPDGPPEVRAVAAALNHLAGRIEDLVRNERESIADLSHRLRTPLTALRLEADALTNAEDAARVGGHVAALDRAVSAVIEEARRRGTEPGACDAAAVVAQRVAFWRVLAEDQARAVTASVPPGPLPVGVAEGDLAACLDALLGNVFSHTPDGTAFAVRLAARPGGGATLTVADEGPGFGGIDPLARGVSGARSTGLGLDIARQTARASGGALTVGSRLPHGAQVTVELGPPR
jgi:signal transduction histidine kinase